MNDLRLAFRALRATPIVSAVAIASLALGIGANTAIFSLVNSLMLRSLPVADPDRLAMVVDPANESRAWSNPTWEQIRDRSDVFDGAFAWWPARFNLARGGEARFVSGIWASGDFFRVLGVPAATGRTFTVDDDRRGGGVDGPVAVISGDFWRRYFGGSADAIGKPLMLGPVAFTVIGVTPDGFFGPDVGQRFDVIVPLGTEPLLAGANSGLDLRGRHVVRMMVRRRADQTLAAATAALHGVQQEIRDPDLQEPLALSPATKGRSPLRNQYQQALLLLMVVAGGVLLIACVNIANLMMARAEARRHEMSLRVALGASRAGLARLLLVESAVLSTMGAGLGIFLAQWMSRLIVQQISTPTNVVYVDLTPDWRVFAFATAAAIATGALFGVAPAWQSMRSDPVDALREQGRGTVGGRSMFPTALVGAQVALSLVLVVAAGLFIRTSTELARQNVGSMKDRVLLAYITAPMTKYTLPQLVATYDRVLDAVRTVPGVERAAISDITPASGSGRSDVVEIPGGTGPTERGVSLNVISPGWLQTYGMRLLAGRDLVPTDRPQSPPVALVNEAFAREFLNGANPVGRSFRVGLLSGKTNVEIVGLLEDTVYRTLRQPATPTVFTSSTQRLAARPFVNVSVLAAHGSPALLSRSIAAAVREVDPELVLQFTPLTEQIMAAMTQERIVALLSGFFGALALLLAGLGLYGVTAYGVSQRRAEIAMRMALGADTSGVVKLVMTRIAIVVGAGTLGGAMLSLWAARFVGTLVWGLEPRDPMTFITAAMILATVATAAGALPAWRASRLSPAEVLKET
jgi:putative ABC transport system permease protein